ncbi:sulfotransferase [Ovoidimarina sediminis]|uniref:sulfotransferase n=1 Tax=Ovoidimarina sediminis TaxID=3079856 RepID=UPI0029064B3C|nr:sulfotransferase [Rhodophyticola sp. MJ-SS7]MDU8944069.1 sulfotransferase [Rhodophyticola sp. MJ-SS7]
MTTERRPAFRRNPALEALLQRLSQALEPCDPGQPAPQPPPLFIVGTPRSGTTFATQWLAASGAFSVPSNFIARFWRAPFVGAMAQAMLTDPALDFRGEFADITPAKPGTRSDLGKTEGMLAPSEFWYFWRGIFPGDGDIAVDLDQATGAEFDLFRRHLAALGEALGGRPVALKGMIVNHQIATLAHHIPDARFLYVERDPLAAAWSLLSARERHNGDRAIWYSFATPDKADLLKRDPLDQVAGQIARIRKDIRAAFAALPDTRHLTLDYRTLCTDPGAAFAQVSGLYEKEGVALEGGNTVAPSEPSEPDIPEDIRSGLAAALSRFGA